MAKTVINSKSVAPYYDDYDSSKQYTHLLAIPGRVAQAREITQIQSTVKNIIKSLGDSILKDGDIIEGCQIIVSTDKKSATVTAGKVYLNGMVLPVATTTVAIKGTGTESVGVKLVEYLVTETEDSTLKDPAQGYDNFNQPGCHRIQSTVAVVVDDSESAILNTLIDGEIAIETYTPEYDTLNQTLARRTYDESGSYIVEGFNTRTESVSDTKYNVVVEAGKAYVLGYELRLPTARRLESNRAQSVSQVEYTRTYLSSSRDYALYADHPFVQSIQSVVGVKEVSETLRNTSNVNSVELSQSRVTQIVSVRQGDTVYTAGSGPSDGDYYLYYQGSTYYIKWNGTSNYPVNGTDYTVTYRYRKDYSATTDYSLVIKDGGHYLRFSTTGDTPEDNTEFTVKFNQYLARKDIVYIDRYGNISLAVGTPAPYEHDVYPEVPLNTLTLAKISNPPNGAATVSSEAERIEVSNVGLTRFTMSDIQNIVNRLNNLEYDQAVSSLNTEARNDSLTNKKGIYTDPLIDLSRIDFYYNLNGSTVIDPLKPAFDIALDLLANIAYLPIISGNSGLTYSSTSTTKKYDRLVTLATTGENVVLSQMNATKSFLVNPYSLFPQLPDVSLSPTVDSWIEDTIIEVPVSLQESSVVKMSTRNIDVRTTEQITNRNWQARTSTSISDTQIGTKTVSYTTEDLISQGSVTYIRQRDVTVEGASFSPNLDNIACYFDGVKVNLTPLAGTQAGTQTGTVKSNDAGSLKAKFTIPANIRTGIREVLLKSNIEVDGVSTEGFSLYIAAGISRTFRRTVTTVTTVLLQRTTTNTTSAVYVDPVGQTFVLDRMTMLKGIDLYFEGKAANNAPVICEIREVSNGTITSQVYAHTSLPASSVNISSTAAVATRFNFSDPVLLEENKEYAFVVRSSSDSYRLWVAELGGMDVSTNKRVLKNPYMTGVMLSSSNNSSWTQHQTTDVKFRLIEDKYSSRSVAQFDQITTEDFSRIYLSADSAIPTGTDISWEYSLDGVSYTTLSPYEIVSLSALETTLSFRATLSKNAGINLSPMIALDTLNVTTSCYDTKGYYVMKNVSGLDGFTNIKVIVDTLEPTGTSIVVKYSVDGGTTISTATKQMSPPPTVFDYNWKENIYTASVSNSTQFKIFIEATSNSKAITPAFRRLRVLVS